MSRLADEMRKTFASMHVSRNFRLFFVGQLISVTGTWVNWTAGAVLVLELTDSGVALGIEAALLFLPVLLFGVYAGSLADRFDKRRILVWSNAGYAVLAAVQFALVATDVVQIWMVFVIAFLTGLILAIEPPTRQSFYVELVGEQHITNAISLNSAVFTGTRVLGGALAGTDDPHVRLVVAVLPGRRVVRRGDRGVCWRCGPMSSTRNGRLSESRASSGRGSATSGAPKRSACRWS